MSNIKLFESKQIRSVWNEADNKWYFLVADVVEALTDSPNVQDYIKKMRKRKPMSTGGQFVPTLSCWPRVMKPLQVVTTRKSYRRE